MSTSEREKTCIDVILATLDCAVNWRGDADAEAHQMTIAFGVAVYLCIENNVNENQAVELLRERFAEYRQHFPAET